uniref:Uncharacterized protein n=1 Tax=viral metagenome TaxID=1070528 RepID=A0A6C0HSA3_9ZZZZ
MLIPFLTFFWDLLYYAFNTLFKDLCKFLFQKIKKGQLFFVLFPKKFGLYYTNLSFL